MKFKKYLNEAGFKDLPKGWDEESVKKWGKTFKKNHGVAPDEKGFFDKCVNAMKDEDGWDEDKAKRFCAAIKSETMGSTYWRGKGKSKKEVEKDVKKHQNV